MSPEWSTHYYYHYYYHLLLLALLLPPTTTTTTAPTATRCRTSPGRADRGVEVERGPRAQALPRRRE